MPRLYTIYIESIYRNVAPRFGRCARCSALAAGVRTDYKAKRRKEKEATERERGERKIDGQATVDLTSPWNSDEGYLLLLPFFLALSLLRCFLSDAYWAAG